ncbi:unnamed protein product [Meloidogyne enterolobii]|uniref:Uncharacterized protein n=2 Tax=Meloidogyne enterolobii TaxID=390850 RepID=A0ACB0YVA1_MELEN
MSIITPGFPEQNTTFNVNKFTLKRIVIEIRRGFALINQESPEVWNALIAPLDWKNYYNFFILILCRAGEFEVKNKLQKIAKLIYTVFLIKLCLWT